MDLQSLLNEAKDPAPCGPDLEYDPAFLALEAAVSGKPEQEIAGKVIAAVEPDWPRVRDEAVALLGRSKDLRIAMHLARALTRIDQLRGFVAGITLINGLLDRFWADVHPRLESDNNNDPTTRLNALSPLEAPKGVSGTETLLRDLRDALVIPAGPQGRLTVRDLLVLEGKLAPSGETQPAAAVEGALRTAVEREAELAGVPGAAVAAVTRLRELLVEKVGTELAPDVGVVRDMLMTVARVVARATGGAAGGLESTQAAAASAAKIAGDFRGRDDVSRAIDLICSYLERTEPANPAPLLLRRAQRLLNKNFVELIADLAPDSLAQVKSIAGLKDQ
ncbi:MAG TPA: type VI secretion system protein TssA [Burkholderiaceae bacterium]|nr:type VI secretion system protein TssA [Burkholderiaceae bacterium]